MPLVLSSWNLFYVCNEFIYVFSPCHEYIQVWERQLEMTPLVIFQTSAWEMVRHEG